MRLLSIVLRCSRWLNPLRNDGGQRLNARGVKFGRNVSCVRYVRCGDVMDRSGAAAALTAAKDIITTHIESMLHSDYDSESLLISMTLSSPELSVGGECSEPASSQNSLDKKYVASGTQNEKSKGNMLGEGCEEGTGADEIRNRLNRSVAPDSRSLGMKLDSGSKTREFRGLRGQGQVDSSPESGQYVSTSSLQADSILRPSSLAESSFVDVRNISSNSRQIANDLQCQDSVVPFASQNSQVHNVANALEPSLELKESKIQVVLPVSCPENGGVENSFQYPVPLTPFSGEIERGIEYERAMVAETAMKSGPAISRSDILFEDEWLLVVNKPCGIYSEHVLATIPSLLQTSSPLASDSSPTDDSVNREETHLHMANRLDRDTTGVMVITKCKKAAGMMSKIFTTRWVQKSYLALCAAPPPPWKHVTVESGHGRSRFGAWRVYAKRDIGRELPGKCVVRDMRTHFMVVAVNKESLADQMDSGGIPTGRCWWEELKAENSMVIAGEQHFRDVLPSVSDLSRDTLLEKLPGRGSLSNSGDEVIIRAFPFTGRTHQIRLHCQYIGMSLRGDVKYGGPHIWNGMQYEHHALHAETLSFRHPFTSEKLFLVAPLPQWARDVGVQCYQA